MKLALLIAIAAAAIVALASCATNYAGQTRLRHWALKGD